MPTQIFPVFFKSQFQVGVLFNQNMWCIWNKKYWEHFWCTWNVFGFTRNCQISGDLPPPQNETLQVPRFAIPFFFSAPPGPLLLGLVGFVGFFFARNLWDLIWKFLFLRVNVNDIFVAVSLAIHMGFLQEIPRILQEVERLPWQKMGRFSGRFFSFFTVLSLETNRPTPILAETFPYVLMSIFWIDYNMPLWSWNPHCKVTAQMEHRSHCWKRPLIIAENPENLSSCLYCLANKILSTWRRIQSRCGS